jgi:outer membrane protein insertion porin family
VEGTQRIDPATVRSYMTLKEGDRFDAGRINESLKALFATGLFADVTIRREDDALAVRVVENPVINRIAFEGNDSLDDETLSPEVQLRPRVVFTRTKVQKDVKRLLDLYQRSGHFAAVIEPKIIKLPQNRVDLVFEIQEGPESGIRKQMVANIYGRRQIRPGPSDLRQGAVAALLSGKRVRGLPCYVRRRRARARSQGFLRDVHDRGRRTVQVRQH